jgi:glucuronate isomerase
MLKYLIRRFRVILIAVIDSGPEFLAKFKAAAEVVRSKVTVITPYNPKANGIVKASHYTIATILSKLGDRTSKWSYYLNAALLTERITICLFHGFLPFYLIYRWELILPIEVSILV